MYGLYVPVYLSIYPSIYLSVYAADTSTSIHMYRKRESQREVGMGPCFGKLFLMVFTWSCEATTAMTPDLEPRSVPPHYLDDRGT